MTKGKKKTEIPTNDPAQRQAANSDAGQRPSNNTREQIFEKQYQNQNPNMGQNFKSK
jgi:hypothetical protein